MTPTQEEIDALLSLPAEAREALAKCEGPGWWPGGVSVRQLRERGPDLAVAAMWILDEEPDSRGDGYWLPADTAAIASVLADCVGVPHRRVWEWLFFKGFTPDRLGALRLLATEWK